MVDLDTLITLPELRPKSIQKPGHGGQVGNGHCSVSFGQPRCIGRYGYTQHSPVHNVVRATISWVPDRAAITCCMRSNVKLNVVCILW